MCRKVGYATEREAQLALVSAIVAKNRGKNQRRERRWYECPKCHRWVLTSMTRGELAKHLAELAPDADTV